MGAPIVHFEINGPDLEAKESFYGALFDWSFQRPNGMPYSLVDTGNGEQGLRGGIGQPPDGQEFVTVYAMVDDVTATLDRAESLGARTVMPRTEMPMVTVGLFADPQGQVFGLVEG